MVYLAVADARAHRADPPEASIFATVQSPSTL